MKISCIKLAVVMCLSTLSITTLLGNDDAQQNCSPDDENCLIVITIVPEQQSSDEATVPDKCPCAPQIVQASPVPQPLPQPEEQIIQKSRISDEPCVGEQCVVEEVLLVEQVLEEPTDNKVCPCMLPKPTPKPAPQPAQQEEKLHTTRTALVQSCKDLITNIQEMSTENLKKMLSNILQRIKNMRSAKAPRHEYHDAQPQHEHEKVRTKSGGDHHAHITQALHEQHDDIRNLMTSNAIIIGLLAEILEKVSID